MLGRMYSLILIALGSFVACPPMGGVSFFNSDIEALVIGGIAKAATNQTGSSDASKKQAECDAIYQKALALYMQGQSVCRQCSELHVSCTRCRLIERFPIPGIPVDSDDCTLRCNAEENCWNDVGDRFTFKLRDLNAEYIKAGCRTDQYPYSLRGIPIYSACDKLIEPELAPAPPPAPAAP